MAAENRLRSVVFVVSFVAFYTIFLSLAAPLMSSGTQEIGDVPSDYAAYYGDDVVRSNNFWVVSGGTELTADASDEREATRLAFPGLNAFITTDGTWITYHRYEGSVDDSDKIRLLLADSDTFGRGQGLPGDPEESRHGIFVAQWWGWWDKKLGFVEYSSVAQNWNDRMAYSEAPTSYNGGTVSLFIRFHDDVDTSSYASRYAALQDQRFYIDVGTSIYNFEASMNSGAGAVFALLTLSMPDIPGVVQLLINIPFYACITYIIFMIVRSLIPFLGGD